MQCLLCGVGTDIIPVLQVGKLRLRAIVPLPRSESGVHTPNHLLNFPLLYFVGGKIELK